MAENTLSVRLRHAAKTLAQWQLITTIPKLGEICLEADSATPPLKYKTKIGGGNLPYYATAAGVITIDVDTLASVKKFTVKNSGDEVNEFDSASADSYVDISMVHSNGNETTQATNPTNKAGLKMTNGTNTYYQKISTAALINYAVDTLILDGNFS